MKSTIRFTNDFFFSKGIGVSILSLILPGFNTPEKAYSEMYDDSIFSSIFSSLAKLTISSCLRLFSKSLYSESISSLLFNPKLPHQERLEEYQFFCEAAYYLNEKVLT